MKIRPTVPALALALATTLTGCSDPCEELPPATEQEQEVASRGIELEREVDDTDCELQEDGTWEQDD